MQVFKKKKKTEAIPRTKLFFFYLNKNWAGNLEDVQPSPSPKKKKRKKKKEKVIELNQKKSQWPAIENRVKTG